jgi:B12-binding domain/radical SAM domain protein
MGNRAPHLVLIHPPSVFDFRERPLSHWLAVNTVASSSAFEYYPLGFLTIMDHLERRGLSVRLVNLAARMAKSRRFDPARFLARFEPLAFGIDLHWLVHADGARETARLLKQLHPRIPVIVGGLSASYYHAELIGDPNVDFVLRGDSTEEPLFDLLRALEAKQPPEQVANLTWKSPAGVRVHPLSYQPERLEVRVDYGRLIRHMLRERDLRSNLMTGYQWPAYCVNMLLFCRGCLYRCVNCGGSNWALGRRALGVRDTELLADEIARTDQLTKHHIGLPGDIRMHEGERLLSLLKAKKLRRAPGLEIFAAASPEFLRQVAEVAPHPELAMSPETHDERIRRAYGRCFSNEMLERNIADFLDLGGKVRLFFSVGLPGQTRPSVRETVAYLRRLLETHNSKNPGKLDATIALLAPFLDPGSPAFEAPAVYGYRRFYTTLAEHRQAMREPDLRRVLNYETEGMSRAELVEATIEAQIAVAELRRDLGLLKPKHAARELAQLDAEK